MYEANTFNETEFNEALNKFKPSGWTPLASSIKAGYEDLKAKAGEDTENILFIVSDGIETCDGNPIEEAKKLAESDLKVKVYIIGFNVDDAGQKQLKDTAAASNGEYYTVNSKVELENTFKKLMEEAVNTIAKNNQKAVNGINVNFRTADLREQLRGIESSFMKVVSLENDVIREALSKLEAEGKIESADVDEIQDKLKARYDALDVYAESLVDQGMEKINNKREELFSIINGS
ncbi:VWA domain-containing protein [Bacillus sp. DTU_2020_1000418_1_SI_GHA_SEK_038]|uniref:vWA domain-containing protein n=1 Tax=Bacillus sp. DTU_2020_1000418_1_SI_GHA_SEK_038 TaxID=3077585 RepID=UPI0028E74EB6|nr:VWA domain-containing protein [Bacillus sp. DTU_2020_1000418_1_SI_GHA_SEK_038]WNS75988.1 VWA domain-containing protein [Bacillus sp. DTU_2020_1000418_1_SI_GHA_SEK_038]